jgi:hypothetical protein
MDESHCKVNGSQFEKVESRPMGYTKPATLQSAYDDHCGWSDIASGATAAASGRDVVVGETGDVVQVD